MFYSCYFCCRCYGFLRDNPLYAKKQKLGLQKFLSLLGTIYSIGQHGFSCSPLNVVESSLVKWESAS